MNMHNDRQNGYAQVNGLNIYYEIHGSGEPLVLLPGGFMSVEATGEIVPQLAATRRVIGVELQGHGHTADIERPLRFELMADDIAALIRQLGLEQADILGYSLGGGVGLQTAIRHPEVVRKLVLVSTVFKRHGWFPEVLAGMAAISVEGFAGSPIHEEYLQDLAQTRSMAHCRCQSEGIAGRRLRLVAGCYRTQNTYPDYGRRRRQCAHHAHCGVLWSARWWTRGRQHGGSPTIPTRRASGHHAC